MTGSRFTRRRAPVSTQGLAFGRARWADLVAQARKVAELVIAEGEPDLFAWSALKRALRETGPVALPVAVLGQSVTHAQLAFVAGCKGLTVAEGSRRTAFARITAEAARLIDGMLTEAATAEAAAWRKQTPHDYD